MDERICIEDFEFSDLKDIWPTESQLQKLNSTIFPNFSIPNIKRYIATIHLRDINVKCNQLEEFQKYLLTIFLKSFLDNFHRINYKEAVIEYCPSISFQEIIDKSDGQNSDSRIKENSDSTANYQNNILTTDYQNSNLSTDYQNSDSTINENGDSTIKEDTDSTIKEDSDSTIKENGDLITNDTEYTNFYCKIKPNNLKIEKTKLKSTNKVKHIAFNSHLIPQILIRHLLIIFPLTLSILIIKTINKYHLKDIIYHSAKKF